MHEEFKINSTFASYKFLFQLILLESLKFSIIISGEGNEEKAENKKKNKA